MVWVFACNRWINLAQVEVITPYSGTILLRMTSGEALRVSDPVEVEEIRQRIAEKSGTRRKASQ